MTECMTACPPLPSISLPLGEETEFELLWGLYRKNCSFLDIQAELGLCGEL